MIQFLTSFADVSYSYTTTTTSSNGSLGAGFWISYAIFLLVAYVVSSLALGKTFEKAGRPFWAGFVPYYNTYVMFELGGQPGAAIFWAFLPFVGTVIFLVYAIKAALEIARRFGKSQAFGIFGLFFFQVIGYLILGYGKAVYQGPDTTNQGQGPFAPNGDAPVAPASTAPVAPQTTPETPVEQPQPPTSPLVQ